MILVFFVKSDRKDYIILAITLDDFFMGATTERFPDEFEVIMVSECTVKRIQPPNKYLNWTITSDGHGGLHLSQPTAINELLEWTNISEASS